MQLRPVAQVGGRVSDRSRQSHSRSHFQLGLQRTMMPCGGSSPKRRLQASHAPLHGSDITLVSTWALESTLVSTSGITGGRLALLAPPTLLPECSTSMPLSSFSPLTYRLRFRSRCTMHSRPQGMRLKSSTGGWLLGGRDGYAEIPLQTRHNSARQQDWRMGWWRARHLRSAFVLKQLLRFTWHSLRFGSSFQPPPERAWFHRWHLLGSSPDTFSSIEYLIPLLVRIDGSI